MNEYELNKLLHSKQELDKRIEIYIANGNIKKQEPIKEEIEGHMQKATHNLEFINDTKEKYSDWIITGCYYAIYQAALALIIKKGYASDNHEATLLLIIKEYYKEKLSTDDIKLLNQLHIDTYDVLTYAEAKKNRKEASYSTKILFDKKTINDSKLKSRLFVNKAKEILKIK